MTEPLTDTNDRRRKKGPRLPTPREILADHQRWPFQEYEYRKGEDTKMLQIKQITDLCWYHGAGAAPVQLVLIHDPDGGWRDEVLLCTDPTLTVEEVVLGYCQRWSVEVAYCDSKQLLGFHDPQVWCAKSVQRAAPMAWFVGVLVVLWYAIEGVEQRQVRRERPWYKNKPEPTFADMLATCRWHLWQNWLQQDCANEAELQAKWAWLLDYLSTAE